MVFLCVTYSTCVCVCHLHFVCEHICGQKFWQGVKRKTTFLFLWGWLCFLERNVCAVFPALLSLLLFCVRAFFLDESAFGPLTWSKRRDFFLNSGIATIFFHSIFYMYFQFEKISNFEFPTLSSNSSKSETPHNFTTPIKSFRFMYHIWIAQSSFWRKSSSKSRRVPRRRWRELGNHVCSMNGFGWLQTTLASRNEFICIFHPKPLVWDMKVSPIVFPQPRGVLPPTTNSFGYIREEGVAFRI